MCWYQIDIKYACFGIRTDTGMMIIEAPPIAKWMEGHHLDDIEEWVHKKDGIIEMLDVL